jgi:cell division protein FtsI (penicillin-binding protein 3)
VHPGSISVPAEDPLILEGQIPDFSGYSKRRLLPLLLRDDIIVEISGDGWVKRQSPPPGTPLRPGMTITLELE